MSEDIWHRTNRTAFQINNSSTELLIELDKLLRDAGYCLSHFNLPLPESRESASENRLLLDEQL